MDIKDKIKHIKYLRLSRQEKYLLNILNHGNLYKKEYKSYFVFNNQIIFEIEEYVNIRLVKNNGSIKKIKYVKHFIWCRFNNFWSEFVEAFNLSYEETQIFLSNGIGNYFDLVHPLCECEYTDSSSKIYEWLDIKL